MSTEADENGDAAAPDGHPQLTAKHGNPERDHDAGSHEHGDPASGYGDHDRIDLYPGADRDHGTFAYADASGHVHTRGRFIVAPGRYITSIHLHHWELATAGGQSGVLRTRLHPDQRAGDDGLGDPDGEGARPGDGGVRGLGAAGAPAAHPGGATVRGAGEKADAGFHRHPDTIAKWTTIRHAHTGNTPGHAHPDDACGPRIEPDA